MNLCDCRTPTRDTSLPTRRFWCAHCGGATPHGRRLSLEETARLVAQAHSLLDRILTDLTYSHEALYGLAAPPDSPGGHPGGHSDPTARRAAADRHTDATTFMAICAGLVKTATAMLVNADDAAGQALWRTDPHRGPADHTPAPYHDPQALYPGRPDLAAAHAAQARRQGRGEL